MLKLRYIGIITALIGLLASPVVFAVDVVNLDLPCVSLELTCEQTTNDTDLTLAVPEVGFIVTVSEVKPGPVSRAYDLYRSYRVPWPRSQ